MQNPALSVYARGALYGIAAVSIWAGFIVVAPLGLRAGPTPRDIAAIRLGVAGSSLLPYLIAKGLAFERLGWIGLAVSVRPEKPLRQTRRRRRMGCSAHRSRQHCPSGSQTSFFSSLRAWIRSSNALRSGSAGGQG